MIIKEFGSEFFLSNKLRDLKVETPVNDTSHLVYLRSGRDALRYVAHEVCNRTKNVLLPAYCCESMIKPFIDMKLGVKFYKLNSEFLADVDDVCSLLKDGDILLYIDYFGKSSFKLNDLLTIKEKHKEVIFIEDRTHDIFNQKVYLEFKPDYMVASLRKWFALPDGGIACSFKDEFNTNPLDEVSFFTTTRHEALLIKNEYLENGNQNLKDNYRNMFSAAEHYLGQSQDIVSMSKYSREFISAFDFDSMKSKRRQNYNYLLDKLSNNVNIDTAFEQRQECPLYFPILINNRDDIQQMLAQENIYCPVIWPIPKEANNICINSNYISEHILAIPCDHRYSFNDMKYIVDKIRKIFDNQEVGGVANE
jgi:selenocysteine lyase/cysteine desulfurase